MKAKSAVAAAAPRARASSRRCRQIEDREGAARFVGSEVWVRRSALPKPKHGEYYWADLEGLEVVTVEGAMLGRVSHLVATGANDVLVAKDGKRERLIPFVLDDYVKEVDFECGPHHGRLGSGVLSFIVNRGQDVRFLIFASRTNA